MEGGPLKLGGARGHLITSRCWTGGHAVSAFSPPEPGVGIKVGAPLPTSHSCGQSTSAGHPNPGCRQVEGTWSGRLCAQLGWCSTDQVGGRSAGDLSTKVTTETLLEALLGAGPSVEEPPSHPSRPSGLLSGHHSALGAQATAPLAPGQLPKQRKPGPQKFRTVACASGSKPDRKSVV